MEKPLALGSLIRANMTRRSARSALHKAGWEWLGGGSFASVWVSPDKSRVVKITKPDAGQRVLVSVAQARPDNPHLPAIYGFLQFERGGFAVETELLDFDGDYGEVMLDDDSPDLDFLEANPAFKQAWRWLDAARLDWNRRHPTHKVAWDAHSDNIMFRDGVPVLTDPLYSPTDHYRTYSRGSGQPHERVDIYGADPVSQRVPA